MALLSHEITPTLKALRSSGLNVVAINNHMTTGGPVISFLYYWGTGSAEELGKWVQDRAKRIGKALNGRRGPGA